jgi:hypothetical protein
MNSKSFILQSKFSDFTKILKAKENRGANNCTSILFMRPLLSIGILGTPYKLLNFIYRIGMESIASLILNSSPPRKIGFLALSPLLKKLLLRAG